MYEAQKVSILIPVYNREKIISETIESALAQTYENIEIIIVDNCSTDKTYEICQMFEKMDHRISVHRNKENIGPVRNWVECLKYSTGEYVKFLWSDDWMDNDFIEKTAPYLQDEKIAFVYGPAYIVNENSKQITYNLYDKNAIINAQLFSELLIFGGNVPVSPGCAIFRKRDVVKNLVVDVPNDNELDFNRFGAGNDLLLFLIPLLEYEKVAYVYSARSYFRAHKDSFTCSNNLDLYYDWARTYYLNTKNDKEQIKRFKTEMMTKSFKNDDYIKINKSIKGGIDYLLLIKKVCNRIFRKIRT